MSLADFSAKWLTKPAEKLVSVITSIVFLFLDFLDTLFCLIYKYLDEYIEGEAFTSCCGNRGRREENTKDDQDGELSDTLYRRQNLFREMGFLRIERKLKDSETKCSEGRWSMNRWSDCGCESCLSWVSDGDHKLHFVVNESSVATDENCKGMPSENVVFLHGFLSSSSFWTQTVVPYFSEQVKQNYRLVAVDLLGFGRSPKPRNCSYTLKDHVGMIEKSVVQPLNLSSFHLVAHSMGCLIALALAAKYSKCVKSITLVAPPYFPSGGNDASLKALTKLAGKKLWPPLAFGSAFMSWYEHLGRFVCLMFCRNHRIWEKIIKFFTFQRDLHFLAIDLTRHTHHSAWSSMHNVICGGAKFMDRYLEDLSKAGVRINVIQGDKDAVVPLECCYNLKLKAPKAEVSIIRNADHGNVILGREKECAHYLEDVWAACKWSNVQEKDAAKI
ncbi:probable lysophospholipase BODYGUARD 4 [Neltuma alba]|uniref:probable lysophospholipase BODYGUARD 4 n=1 Tax=Neltuma alba TaxID=207710 RepID=UPI0010A3513D|nr:probable lysophospholipase BODYGUARD 4 [Prosopis alba]XP_028784394.1 probable lysophospholipase BODYGUARD 4 [Prosopis alba]